MSDISCIECGEASEHLPGCRFARAQEPTGRPMSPAGIAEQREREIATRNPVTSDDLAGQAAALRQAETRCHCDYEAGDNPCPVHPCEDPTCCPPPPTKAFRPPTVTVERSDVLLAVTYLRAANGVGDSKSFRVDFLAVADRLERAMKG